jgi:hypothetical protein
MQFRSPIRIGSSAIGAILCVLASWAALAHHSNSMFDRSKEVVITGVVREFQWTNPHIFIELTVSDSSGQHNYSVQGPAPGVIRKHGWKFNSLSAGDKVSVKVHPLKSGGPGGILVSLTKDGVTLSAGSSVNEYEEGK